ncbi:MAG: CDP-alcohol phosphatidyltransferase family protein [Acidobacteriota bacterium]|nr:CDP-alcohol phosphatidyltransferase family protein [Blastocatellia bacterium]MDW8411704.1 CDP-alcohol phosphatidyltransferase family protein [Acidobacteriota bacterium]
MYTVPNVISLLRLLSLPLFVYLVLERKWEQALAVFLLAGISDGLDGYLARKLGQTSRLGQWLDPAADKLLLVVACAVLSIPSPGYEPLPIWLTVAVFARDLGIVVGALIVRLTTGFSDFKPSLPGKLNTLVLTATLVFFLLAQVVYFSRKVLAEIYFLALAMTIFSGVHYIYFVRRALKDYRRKK